MTLYRRPHDAPLEGLRGEIEAIRPEALQRAILAFDDNRVRHYLTYRAKESDANTTTVRDECARIQDYLDYLADNGISIGDVSKQELLEYFSHRIHFGLSKCEAEMYWWDIRRLHVHLMSIFGVQSISATSFERNDFETLFEDRSYANLHRSEVTRLARAAFFRRDRIVTRLLHQAALHPSSIINLNVGDFSDPGAFLTVTFRDALRRVPLLEPLAAQLRAWLVESHPDPSDSEAPMFPSKYGGRLQSSRSIGRLVTRAAKRAEMRISTPSTNQWRKKRLTPETLRLGGIDHWRADGVPEGVCEELTTGERRSEFTAEPRATERDAFETLRDRFEP